MRPRGPGPHLCFPYAATLKAILIAYRLLAQKATVKTERWAMADVIYLVIGIVFFVLTGFYAAACDRL